MVPTKYKGIFAKLGPYGKKVDLSRGYWNPKRKLVLATHFSVIISLES